ncbi:hypothetical protein RhiirC2_791243 [Rhizophagus irregularis]|uniref:RRM domain-containing protein n=1 Tax=Rhizophagus irregularis TaxID=588596 RepID=A0A2N1MJK4_9GLOM|nr:hypothetical protein RhiirC2_791243 [Rhizophagus irregularis]
MSSSMNRNPFSQPPDNNKDGKKDVFNLTEDGQKVSTQQSFSTFTSQDEPDFTEVLSKRNTSSNDKQASNSLPEDLDDQQNGKLSFRARALFNKILDNNKIAKIKFFKSQLYKDYNIVKIITIYQKKDKENLFQIEFNNQDQYDKFINAEFKFIENDEPIKFQIKDDSYKIKKIKEKETQKSRMIQVLDIPLNYKLYEIRAVFSKYGKIEDLYIRVKVRVIQLLLNDESREDRYGYALKLTGLPFGTTGRELIELLKESGAKSVVILRNPKNYNLLKYAMVYFPGEDVLTEIASLKLNIKGSSAIQKDNKALRKEFIACRNKQQTKQQQHLKK